MITDSEAECFTERTDKGDKTMAKLYGEELRQSILKDIERLKESQRDRDRRVAKGMTDYDDCFVSMRAESNGIYEAEMKLDILDNGGTMVIEAVIDEEGKEVNVRWVHTRYGGAYVGRGIFASSKKALCKKTGWHLEDKAVPCWVKFEAPRGMRGLAGAMCGSYYKVRWHTNMLTGEYVGYPQD